MRRHFILKQSSLEDRTKEGVLSREDVMYFNIQRLKGKVFMGYARAFALESYYKLFLDYNGKKKD